MSEQEKDNRRNEAEEERSQQNGAESEYRFMDQKIKKRPVERRHILVRALGVVIAGVAVGLIASLVFSLTQPAFREKLMQTSGSGRVSVSPEAEEYPEAYGSADEEDTAEAEAGPEAEEALSAGEDTETEEEPGTEERPEEEALTEPEETPADGPAQDTEEMPEKEEETPETEEGPETAEPAEKTAAEEKKQDTEQQETEQPAAETAGEETDEPEEPPAGLTLQEYRRLYRDMMEVAEKPERALVQVIGITSEMDYFNRNYENQQRISGLSVAKTDDDLFILTEYRVVDQVERIQVVFFDGTMTDAVFQKADQNTGLAVLKVPLKNIREETREELVTAPLGNSYNVIRGEPILALGSPLGFADSIAYGIVTSVSSKAPVVDTEYGLLTTDIDGSADGSGVLIDLNGRVIGIITNEFGSSTGSITGLAISGIKSLINDLSNDEPQNYVGIRGQDVTQDITERTGIPRGMLVTEVVLDSPAMLAGIKEYDVIVQIGEQPVETIRQYHSIIESLQEGQAVVVRAMRRGTEGFAEVKFVVTVDSR